MSGSSDTVPQEVLNAFGVTGPTHRLDGGRSLCHRAGNVVLKPADVDEESNFVAQVVSALLERKGSSSQYRLPQPLPASNAGNGYLHKGWTAWVFVAGVEGPAGRFEEILSACRHFHADLGKLSLKKPDILSKHSNRWREADLVTWSEKSLKDVPNVSQEIYETIRGPLECLAALMKPFSETLEPQLIHADMTGNVLFDDGQLGPAIIDMTFYWRPVAFAEAIIVADGLSAHRQGRPLLELYGTDPARLQLLVRALYWRCLTYAIDSDIAWVQQHLGMVDFNGAAELLRQIMTE